VARPPFKESIPEYVGVVVWFAVFPGHVRYVYAPRSARGAVRYLVGMTVFQVVMREWVGPRAQVAVERRNRELAELAEALGRKPTHDEVVEDYGRRRAERRRRRHAR
jgi:hypothetical protein